MANGEKPYETVDQRIERKLREIAEKVLVELRRRRVTEEEIQKLLSRNRRTRRSRA